MKTRYLLLPLALLALFCPSAVRAQTAVTASSVASIRSGTGLYPDGGNAVDVGEDEVGYARVAFADPVANTAGKAYFEFDLTGATPNTNANATFKFDRYYNSGTMRTRFWVLNQAYPGMSSTIVWNTAQANNTANNNLYTVGESPAYGSLLEEKLIGGAGGGSPETSFTLPAPWGQYILGGKVVLALTAASDPANDSARLRVSITSTNFGSTNPAPSLNFSSVVGNPPAVSSIPNLVVAAGKFSATNAFTVSDIEDGPNALVTAASSSDETVVPVGNVFFSGSGSTRSVYVKAAESGVATITVTVTDSNNNPGQRNFTVTVPALPVLTVTNSVFATVRAGNGDVDENAVGYVRVAYEATVTSSSSKGYFLLDLADKNPNTSANATFTFTRAVNNGATRTRMWALNQAYPGMAQTITWADAQANNTASNDMLTSGAYTATLLDEQSVQGGSGTFSFTLPAPWNNYLIDGKLVLVFSATDHPTNNSNRLRISCTSAALPTLAFTAAGPGNLPTMTAINDITNVLGATSVVNFTLNDAEDDESTLVPKAVSSDEAVIPSTNLVFSGSGAARSLSIQAVAVGKSKITVTVLDSDLNPVQRSFTVSVIPPNFPPVITGLAPTNTMQTSAVVVPFVVGDLESAAGSLVVTSAVPSVSAHLLSGVALGGSGANRTATFTPVSGADGVGIATIGVTDPNGAYSTSNTACMVVPNNDVIFSDHFDYPNASGLNYNDLRSASANYWYKRGGSSTTVNLVTNGMAYVRSGGGSYDIARLYDAPNSTQGPIYYGFRVSWLTPPTTTNAHILHLWAEAGEYNFARVYLSTNGFGTVHAPAPPGQFRICVSNGGIDESFIRFATNLLDGSTLLTTNVSYTIVVRWDGQNPEDKAHIWINPSSESDPSAPGLDFYGDVTPAATHIGLRSDGGMGSFLLDDLKVAKNFNSVLPVGTVAPVITGINFTPPNKVEINFTGSPADSEASFGLFRAAEVNGEYVRATFNVAITRTGPGTFKAVRTFPLTDRAFFKIGRLSLE